MTIEKSQSDKFRDLAREAQADENEAAFDDKLRKMLERPVAPEGKPRDQ